MKRLVILCLGLLLSIFTSAAMGQENADLSILDIRSTPAGNIQMVVSVLDEHGKPIKELSNANFKLNIEGEEIEEFSLEPVSSAKSPLSVIMGIDVSGSMKGVPIREAKKAASIFLDQLDKEDFTALMVFGSSVNVLTDFTREKHEVREEIENLTANEDWTWLYQATYEGLEKASRAPTSRVAIVLLTDGKDERSPRTEESVIGKIQGTQIPLYTIGLGPNAQVGYLERIAGSSGGYFLFTPEADELSRLYEMVLDQLKNQYLIEVSFPNPPGEYTSILTLSYRGNEITARKGFLHISPEQPIQQAKEWLYKPIIWGIMALTVIIVGIVIAYIFKRQETVPVLPKVEKAKPDVNVMIKKKIHPIEFPYDDLEGADGATRIFQMPSKGTVGLEIDIHQPLPLTFALIDKKNKKEFNEVFITRYDKEKDRFFSEEKIYLLLSDSSISRPDGERDGHARIFIDEETGTYKIEDIGSASGTKLKETALSKEESLDLVNGDTMTIGNIRLKYYDERTFSETTF